MPSRNPLCTRTPSQPQEKHTHTRTSILSVWQFSSNTQREIDTHSAALKHAGRPSAAAFVQRWAYIMHTSIHTEQTDMAIECPPPHLRRQNGVEERIRGRERADGHRSVPVCARGYVQEVAGLRQSPPVAEVPFSRKARRGEARRSETKRNETRQAQDASAAEAFWPISPIDEVGELQLGAESGVSAGEKEEWSRVGSDRIGSTQTKTKRNETKP